MLALDTETTGIDLHHGAKPFFISTCNEDGNNICWEWDVNPITRQPIVSKEQLQEVREYLFPKEHNNLILHNAKFDFAALNTLGYSECFTKSLWKNVDDTLLAGHLLKTNLPHNLTDMCIYYLNENIAQYEVELEKACKEARRIVKREFKDWKIAKCGLEDMPSAKGTSSEEDKGGESEKPWKFDMWLPRAVAKALGYPTDHPWWTVLHNYSSVDSSATLALWKILKKLIKEENLWEIYTTRKKLLPIIFGMEKRGVTISQSRTQELLEKFRGYIEDYRKDCLNIAKKYKYPLDMPKGANNNSLKEFCFGKRQLNLPAVVVTETGQPSLNKAAMSIYSSTLEKNSNQYKFISNLEKIRAYGTSVSYLESYQRFWLPKKCDKCSNKKQCQQCKDWSIVYPSLNPTSTNTLRFSSRNPNSQNISKKKETSSRYCFGPSYGREWWSLDYENLELRIPAYEAGEQAMIDLFEKEHDPPYYGSNHLLCCHILHKELFDKCINNEGILDGRLFKDGEETKEWYQRTKNGNFAVQYGAVEHSGTADRAYGVKGAQRKIQSRLGKINDLNRKMVSHADAYGYVETIPDNSIKAKRGYPIYCQSIGSSKVLETQPLSYHVQSTAMWCTIKSMIRVYVFFEKLNNGMKFKGKVWVKNPNNGYFITLQVHDELVLDMPIGKTKEYNMPIVMECKRLMELSGRDIGIPLRVSFTQHLKTWSK